MSTPFLLIAAPDGPTEDRGQVVLIAVDSDTGSLGFTINREAYGESFIEALNAVGVTYDRAQAVEGQQAWLEGEGFVLIGGNIDVGHVWLLFDSAEELPADCARLAPELFITASVEAAAEVIRQKRNRRGGLVLVRGHRNWKAGELRQEIDEGKWLVLPIVAEHVFATPVAARWREALCEAMGAEGPWWSEAPIASA